jgi:hypothetical protein
MKEIEAFNQRLSKQRKTTSALVGVLLTAGFISAIPMFSDAIKHEETIFCYAKKPCLPANYKRGISFLIDRERRNQLFDENIKIKQILPPEDSSYGLMGIVSSAFFLSAYVASKSLTNYQEKSIHSQFKLLKIKALENDLLENLHIDLFTFTKQNEGEIIKQGIARKASSRLAAMKSKGEMELDHLNGQLQGQLALKKHTLTLTELDKETAKNQLELLETQKKIEKLNGTLSPENNPKNDLINALKSHEGGWLWDIINSLKPLWLIGNQGSGKTYTASAIALIRKYCLYAPVYYLIDRHATGDNAEAWQYLKATHTAESEGDIASALSQSILYWGDRIKSKPSDKSQIIIDEFTNLRGLIGEGVDIFFKLSLSDTRKAKCYLLGITHNDTNSSFAEGTKDARRAGMILIQKFSANGETPLPRVVIRHGLVDASGNNLEDIEKTLPGWLHPEKIYAHFNNKPIEF